MSEPIPIKKPTITTEVKRVDLHDSSPNLANSKTLSKDTLPNGKMTYTEGSPVIRVESRGEIVFIPVTNTKAIWMKT